MKSLRWIYRGVVLLTAAAISTRLWTILRVDGVSPLEYLYLALVAILAWWISASFWLAALGAYAQWRGIVDASLKRPPDGVTPFSCNLASFLNLHVRVPHESASS